MNEYRHRRINNPSFSLSILFIATIIVVSFFCYTLLGWLLPVMQRDWGPHDNHFLQVDQQRLVSTFEQIRQYRHKYLGALGLSANITVAAIPQVLERANLTLREQLLLEPIVLQLVQWGYFDNILGEIPNWIHSGVGSIKGKDLDKSDKFLKDRYEKLHQISELAIENLQKSVIGLGEIGEKSRNRMNKNFLEENGVIRAVVQKDPNTGANNETWIESVKHDIGDLVKQIENSGGDVFSKLHRAGLAHLETVIRLPGEDEGQIHPNDQATHHNVTGHSAGSIIDPYNNRFVLSRPSNLAIVGEDGKLLTELLTLLVGSILLGMIFEFCGLSSFLGYLTAGMLAGPSCFDMIQNLMQVNTVGQFCLLMIVGSLGLEFSLGKIQAVWIISLFGTILMSVCSSIITCFIGTYIFHVSLQQTLFLGLMLSLSSTVVAMKCLQSSGDKTVMGTIVGKSVMGILVVQDLLFCLALAILPVFASGHASFWGFISACMSFGVKTGIYMISVMILCKIIAFIAPKMVFDHLCVIGFIATVTLAGHYLGGVSVELCVFLAAMSMSTFTPTDHPHSHELQETRNGRISTLSEIASIFFFTSIGLLLDMRFLWGELFLLVPLSIAVILLKSLVITLIMRLFSLELRHAATIGVGLSQISELALMLGARGRKLGLITAETHYILAGITALGMVIAPILWRITLCVDMKMKRTRRDSDLINRYV